MAEPNNNSRADCNLARLTPELIQRIASFLHQNEVTRSFKLVNKEIAASLRRDYKTFKLRRAPAPARFCPTVLEALVLPPLAELPWPGADFVSQWGRPEPWRVLTRRQRQRLLCLAASSHHASSLDAALAHCGARVVPEALAAAAAVGDVNACERLLNEEGCEWDAVDVWSAAIMSGQLGVCRWLKENGVDAVAAQAPGPALFLPPDVEALTSHVEAVACFCGQRELLGMLQAPGGTGASTGAAGMATRGPQAHAGLAAAAAEGGQVELLELLQLLGGLAAPPMSNNDNDQHFITLGVAYGCPLEVLQRCCERAFGGGAEDGAAEGAGAGAGAGGGGAEGGLHAALSVRHSRRQQLLLRAATSPTPDWAAKCEWLLLGWGSKPRQWSTDEGALEAGTVRNLWRHAATQPGYAQRLQWLAARGLRLPNAALEAAGWAGDLAAVEFCLSLPLQAPAASSALAVEDEAGQAPQVATATAALAAGQVPVLRLLRGRGGAVDWGDLVDAVMFECVCEDAGCSDSPCLPALRYLAMEGGLDKAEEAAVDWSEVFTSVAQHGADLALLRNLHEQHGAAVDPKAVAGGGSEEQLEWAMQLVQQPGSGRVSGYGQVELFEAALEAGNWATSDWLYRRGLLGPGCTPQQEQWHLQRVFRDVAGQMGDSSDDSRVVPTLWHLYRWCNMQWSRKCRRALQECAVRAAHLGRLRVVSGQARQTREMLRDADAALAVGRCSGGVRRESVVSEEEGSEESEEGGSEEDEEGSEEESEEGAR